MAMSEFYRKADEAAAIRTVQRALDPGVTLLDTASELSPAIWGTPPRSSRWPGCSPRATTSSPFPAPTVDQSQPAGGCRRTLSWLTWSGRRRPAAPTYSAVPV
jgi:hypothetical protein